MTTKERVRDLLDRLPDDCSVDDVLYHLYVIQSIDRGLAEATAGATVSHEDVSRELRQKWGPRILDYRLIYHVGPDQVDPRPSA